MPEYLFRCRKCGRLQTITHSMREEHPEVICENCGEPMDRKFTSPKVHYRGDGFYATDHVLSEPTEEEVLDQEMKEMGVN